AQLGTRLGIAGVAVALHRFPDGESRLRLPARCAAHTIVCRSLDQPNEKLVELMLAAQTARDHGAARLTLIAPYLCYMRQDAQFAAGEAVSQRIVGRFLSSLFDAVITVDPHLHRISRLEEAVPGIRCIVVAAAAAIARHLRRHAAGALLVGPDDESRQWVAAVAEQGGFDYLVADKQRHGDREVTVTLPPGDLRGRAVVLVDDIVSSGQTLARAAAMCREAGAAAVDAVVTHALCPLAIVQMLREAGVARLWSTDTVPHPTNAIAAAPLIAEGLRALHAPGAPALG
ncbi:MAG TPA: ribose-phosphate diphosphokinase, partial [Burkholderiaceae bacterium]|nr:ribose-phosphate diphosphokinase [Burkholderiaceae bacterium]